MALGAHSPLRRLALESAQTPLKSQKRVGIGQSLEIRAQELQKAQIYLWRPVAHCSRLRPGTLSARRGCVRPPPELLCLSHSRYARSRACLGRDLRSYYWIDFMLDFDKQ